MSHIFEALQRAEPERSGIEFDAVTRRPSCQASQSCLIMRSTIQKLSRGVLRQRIIGIVGTAQRHKQQFDSARHAHLVEDAKKLTLDRVRLSPRLSAISRLVKARTTHCTASSQCFDRRFEPLALTERTAGEMRGSVRTSGSNQRV